MATITKRQGPGGRWVWQVRIRKKGHPQRTRTFDLRAHAVTWARNVERDIDAGVATPHDNRAEHVLLAEVVTRYEQEILPNKRGGAQESARLRRLRDRLGQLSLAALGTAQVAEYRDARLREGASAQTVKHELGLLNRILRACTIDWGIALPRGLPTAFVRKPSPPHGRDRRLLPEEEARLLAACEAYGGPIKSLVILALETAMRRGELAAMRWEHLDGKVLLVPETKTGEPRRVPLSTRAREILAGLPRCLDGWVWGIRADSITQAFDRAVKRARANYEKECRAKGEKPDPRMLRDLRFHDLRHEATSRLFERGLNPMEVAAITGHKTLQMLKRYTHLRAEDLVERLG